MSKRSRKASVARSAPAAEKDPDVAVRLQVAQVLGVIVEVVAMKLTVRTHTLLPLTPHACASARACSYWYACSHGSGATHSRTRAHPHVPVVPPETATVTVSDPSPKVAAGVADLVTECEDFQVAEAHETPCCIRVRVLIQAHAHTFAGKPPTLLQQLHTQSNRPT